ncbi:hypothetical protein VRK_34160 [Vibrio sp. MEBiC08052]|nr:hypothetical protein VRK_34160 [Vibrio sp. MEBiC08052]
MTFDSLIVSLICCSTESIQLITYKLTIQDQMQIGEGVS